MQEFVGRIRAAVDKYRLIEDGDHIAVGVSGGKDSLALLCGVRTCCPPVHTRQNRARRIRCARRHADGDPGAICKRSGGAKLLCLAGSSLMRMGRKNNI